MTAGRHNFTIEAGANFNPVITLTDADGGAFNLTGYTARLQARKRITDAAAVLDLSSGDGELVMGGTAGTISIDMDASITAALTFAQAIYDLEIESGAGVVTRILEGQITVSPEVTR